MGNRASLMFSVEWRIGKAPSSKLQKNPKLQNPKSACEARSITFVGVGRFALLKRLVLVLGIWSFFGAWSLELLPSLSPTGNDEEPKQIDSCNLLSIAILAVNAPHAQST
jgi:hypothetical protein